MSQTISLSKYNFRFAKIPFLVFGLCILLFGVSDLVTTFMLSSSGDTQQSFGLYFNGGLYQSSAGWFTLLFLALFAILTPARNFTRYMHLNTKKSTYLNGTALSYVIAALVASLINIGIIQTLDRWMEAKGYLDVWNMMDVFGWSRNGLMLSFFQQFAFMLCLTAFFHMVTTIQHVWYGWVFDGLLLIILCVFIPIAPLRQTIVWFFNMILFHVNPFVQIASALICAAAFYGVSIVSVKQRTL